MKTGNKQVKNLSLIERINALSVVTVMALSLSTGAMALEVSDAAQGAGGSVAASVSVSTEAPSVEIPQWMTKSDKPEEFFKGLRKEIADRKADLNSTEDKYKEELEAKLDAEFNSSAEKRSKKVAFKATINRMSDIFTAEELHDTKKLTDEQFLKILFDDATKLALGIKEQKPKDEETTKRFDEINAKFADLDKKLGAMIPSNTPVGEQGSTKTKEECEREAAQLQDALNQMLAPLEQTRLALAQKMQDLLNQSQAPEVAVAKKDDANDLNKILPGLLANVLNPNDQNNQPQATPFPFFPQQQQLAQNNPRNSAFDRDIPEGQEQVVPPVGVPAAPENNGPIKATVDVDPTLGKKGHNDARDAVSKWSMRNMLSTTLMGTRDWVTAKIEEAKAKADLVAVSNDADAAKDTMDAMETVLDSVSKNPEVAVGEALKQRKAALEQAIADGKDNLTAMRNSPNAQAKDEGTRQGFAAEVNGQLADIRAKQAELRKVQTAFGQMTDLAKDTIGNLKKRYDSLASYSKKLEAKKSELNQEVAALGEISRSAKELAAQQQQSGGMWGAIQNRFQSWTNNGSAGNPMSTALTGGPSRGPLGNVPR